jgi:hypothetical protein
VYFLGEIECPFSTMGSRQGQAPNLFLCPERVTRFP